MLLVTMVLHFFWQRHCDRQDGWDPALHRGEHAELDEQGTEAVAAPTWYALLPIIPFVLMMTFSKLLVTTISVSVEVAMLLSVFIGMLCELLRTRSVRTAFAGLSSFLDGMGKCSAPWWRSSSAPSCLPNPSKPSAPSTPCCTLPAMPASAAA